MKFHYAYHDKDNKRQDGVIDAASRDAAYALLRKQGIKPTHVDLAPGLLNRIQSIGKRGFAIGVLGAGCLVLGIFYFQTLQTSQTSQTSAFPRQQIYGDPGVLRTAENQGWANVFVSPFDRHLAKYAIPGRRVAPSDNLATLAANPDYKPVAVLDNDFEEYAKMKRIVNGMKDELREYKRAGGTVMSYFRRLDIRQNAECGIYDRVRRELSRETDKAVWDEKNGKLRAMGLPMVERNND